MSTKEQSLNLRNYQSDMETEILEEETLAISNSIGTTFTDGSRYGNVMVRELFINKDIWKIHGCKRDLILLQARSSAFTPGGALITIADLSSYDSATNLYHDYFYSHNYQDDVITLYGMGAFAGMTCYIVVNWNTAWSLCEQHGFVNGNEIIFNARINRYAATHIKLSPVIANYLEQNSAPDIGTVVLPTDTVTRESFTIDTSGYQEVDVYDYSALCSAINGSNKVIINLKADIQLSSTLNISANKTVIIKGGTAKHKIYEFNAASAIIPSQQSGGRKYATFAEEVDNDKLAFNTNNGEMLLLAKSRVYHATGWQGGGENVVSNMLKLDSDNRPVNEDADNVFVCFGIWYQRKAHKVAAWLNGVLAFMLPSFTTNEYSFYTRGQSYFTKKPYFFLKNYDDGTDPNGVLIKNETISIPSAYSQICKCVLNRLIKVQPGGKLKLENIEIFGGIDAPIVNDGDLCIDSCKVSNKVGHGIISYGKLFVTNSDFVDIDGNGILAKYETSWAGQANYVPYVEVVNSHFQNIGIYGSNVFGVDSCVKGYIVNNTFVDANYGAIRVGNISVAYDANSGISESSYKTIVRNASQNLVEYNTISYTNDWKLKRKSLGLQDSGAIYVATNNNKAIIRYNKVLGVGGPDHEWSVTITRGIFCDDGAYNMSIYCNIIAHTEQFGKEHYDIDSRDCYENNAERVIPDGQHLNDNNYIAYNMIDGCLKMQEGGSTHNGTINLNPCVFKKNILIRPCRFAYSGSFSLVNMHYHPYLSQVPIVYDYRGYIDANGNIVSNTDYQSILGFSRIGYEED